MSDNDDYEPYEWQPGDPADWGDGICAPDIPYMGYLNGDDDEDDEYSNPHTKTKDETLYEEAWKLREEGKPDEALVLIDRALQYNDRIANYWNVKAIILEDKCKYAEALKYYDEALKRHPKSKVIKNNKAYSLAKLADMERFANFDWQKGLDLVNEAFKLLSDDEDKSMYFRIKGYMLEGMGKRVDANVCFLLASGMDDKVEKINEQRKIINESKHTLINITATNHYENFTPFQDSPVVNLIREPENRYDRDAIRVELEERTVGYVANSSFTLIEGIKSASDIKDIIKPDQKAQVMFIFADEYVIAKLIF